MEHVNEAAGRRPLRVSVQQLISYASATGDQSVIAMLNGIVKRFGKEEDWSELQKLEVEASKENRKLIVMDGFLCGVETVLMLLVGCFEGIGPIEDFDHEERLKSLLEELDKQGLLRFEQNLQETGFGAVERSGDWSGSDIGKLQAGSPALEDGRR